MKKSELLNAVENKPREIECCKECKQSRKDCEPNPLNCIDFCIANRNKLIELGFNIGF